ncbi:MAG TPA: tRNA (adenine-N1)-methyltransferase [Candidatus Bathyarchaeota archaeon]|nr:tRNA (adenine-N1)-methyltransferase [Candidatus Bathyarchaeota archaeon]
MGEKMERDREIIEGEYVILYLDRRRKYLVQVKRNRMFHTHRGYVDLGEVIGRRYGEAVKSHLGFKFYIFKPTIRNYVMKVERKTQIIYPKDIALIITYTGIGPGSRVIEAGTGSGALTTALAYYVRPDGKVYSYDIKEEYLKKAEKNIRRAGLEDYVELKLKDVTEGFEEENVDAVVLDLATPWLVVKHAYNALADWGSIASYSPTVEQVIKTVEALRKTRFKDIECIECLIRNIKVKEGETRPETFMVGHTGYITFARKTLEGMNK